MIRAWHYIDGITDSVDGVQPYQAFNNARWDIYKGLLRGREAVKFGNGCIRLDEDGHPIPENVWLPPAATGIGTSGGARFVFGCTILVPADPAKTTLRFLANKKQVSAHSYPPDQLVGGVRPPQFSRGIDEELEAGANSETFVSGTASITKAISRYTDPREAVRQTLLTIHNMGIVLLAAKGQPPALGAVLDECTADNGLHKTPVRLPKNKGNSKKKIS
ncbi:MAG: hypothetical protein NTV07_01005 [Candidatus Omnitrophica bacterium]|nr:hypothetical protein [Candidatus Omnitrophota bacterium]